MSLFKKQKVVALVLATAVAVLGVAVLIKSGALSPSGAVEPELGTVTSGAAAMNDAAASGGRAVRFGGVKLPSNVLNLANWKLTLPVDTSHAGNPDEITQPELAGFQLDPYFTVSAAGDGVVFRAHAGGATTSGSGYPRSELREMANNGSQLASWSNATGTHTMVVKEAFTHLPAVKPHAVGAQIHDASDDIIMARLEGSRLFIEGNGANLGDLDTNYSLGTIYTLKIVASGGRIKVYYNDVLKADIAKSGSDWYFKAGCYTQSNTSKGDLPTAYGEVIIYDLQITHTQ